MQSLEMWRKSRKWNDEAAWLRLRAQIRMAEWMVGQHPEKADWAKALHQAGAVVSAAGPEDSATTLLPRVENALQPLAAAAKTFKVHCVGHAHIDMNWMWGWPETVMTTLDSFRTVLTLMEEFPDFKFSQSQASVYEIVRQFDSAMFKTITDRIHEGRWEVTASHWVENDMNLVSGEALVRHLLQTRAYMKQHFDLEPEDVSVCWAPDTFGHPATEPNYLVRGGVRHIYLHRPGYEKQPAPEAFWWVGTDDSRVLVRNDQRRGYNSVIEPQAIFDAVRLMEENHSIKTCQIVYGVGDHGGGPTRRDLLMFSEMNSWPIFPSLIFSTTGAFFAEFERLADGLPVLHGELNTEMTGCYTTQALIKRDNRLGEGRMLDVETVTAWAAATGTPRPTPANYGVQFDESWRRVLFSQFHDILPGSCVRDSRLYCHGQFQDTMAFTTSTLMQTLRALATRVTTTASGGRVQTLPPRPALFSVDGFGSGSGIGAKDGAFSSVHGHGLSLDRPFVVFNTAAVERTEVVKFKLWDRDLGETAETFRAKRFNAVDGLGQPLSVQPLGNGSEMGHVFQVYAVRTTVPSLGYTTVIFREDENEASVGMRPADGAAFVRLTTPPYHCSYMSRERIRVGFESDRLAVRFDTVTGRIVSLFDKVTKIEMVNPSVGIGLEYAVEQPGGHSAWSIYSARQVCVPQVTAIRGVMDGPNTASVEVDYQIERSTVKLIYSLDAGETAVRVDFSAEWLERGSKENGIPNLRFAIGTVLHDATPIYEIPFGALARTLKDDQEEPALRWALLEAVAGPNSVLVCNDCKYGHAVEGGTLRVNLVRSAYDPDRLPDLGEHTASLRIALVSRGSDLATVTKAGQAFNHPLLVLGTTSHAGPWPATDALVKCTGTGIVLDCLKQASDGNGFIVRVHNTSEQKAEAVLAFSPRMGTPISAQAVDLLERPVADGSVILHQAAVHIHVAPYALSTVRLAFREEP